MAVLYKSILEIPVSAQTKSLVCVKTIVILIRRWNGA
jgi:hypothetical protein